MSSNRSWMYNRRKDGGLADEFIQGVQQFIEFALSNPDYMSGDKIKCPCVKCDNRRFETPAEVTYHLYRKGFTKQYMQWVAQGEPIGSNPSYEGESSLRNSVDSMGLPVMEETNNPYRGMIVDAIGYMMCMERMGFLLDFIIEFIIKLAKTMINLLLILQKTGIGAGMQK